MICLCTEDAYCSDCFTLQKAVTDALGRDAFQNLLELEFTRRTSLGLKAEYPVAATLQEAEGEVSQ